MKPATFRTKVFPSSRLATLDVGVLGGRKHAVAGLLEVDVTNARRDIRRAREAGVAVSFHAWFTHVVARTAAAIPEAHALRRGTRSLVLFDRVDIAMPVERVVDGERVPLVMVVRDAASKTPAAIKSEIDAARGKRVDGEEDYVLSEHSRSRWSMELFYKLPQRLRLAIMSRILGDPLRAQAEMGTIIITNVSAAADFCGWILPRSIHNLSLGVGAIVSKPRVVEDRILPRDVLHLTALFDHDVIDGAPAARFMSLLVRSLEAGCPQPQCS